MDLRTSLDQPALLESSSPMELSILLVDDDEDLREALGECLESCGHEVVLCGGCREAMARLNESGQDFHIILTDLILPDGDGFEIIKLSQEKNSRALTAIMTGYASLETALKAIRLGAYDYITKPFNFDEIEILIRNMCDKVRLMEENRQANRKVCELYAQLAALREEKVELASSNCEMRREFERLSRKLDCLIELLGGKVPGLHPSEDVDAELIESGGQ